MQEARQSWFCHLTSPAMGKWSVIHLQPQFFSQVEWITVQGHCEAIIFIFFFFLIFIWLHWVLVAAFRIFDLCCVLQALVP